MSMTAGGRPPTRKGAEAKIAKQAWRDGPFRTEFLARAAGWFGRCRGLPAAQLPCIVVPAKPAAAGQISEQERRTVSGGSDVISVAVATVATFGGMVGTRVASATASGATSAMTATDADW